MLKTNLIEVDKSIFHEDTPLKDINYITSIYQNAVSFCYDWLKARSYSFKFAKLDSNSVYFDNLSEETLKLANIEEEKYADVIGQLLYWELDDYIQLHYGSNTRIKSGNTTISLYYSRDDDSSLGIKLLKSRS